MLILDTRSFPYTTDQLTTLEQMLAGNGIVINASVPGEAIADGWDISWTFPDPKHIAVSVRRHPFAEEGFFWSRLGSILKG